MAPVVRSRVIDNRNRKIVVFMFFSVSGIAAEAAYKKA